MAGGKGIVPSRARRSAQEIDGQKLQEFLAGPGMDTREWVKTGTATADAFKDSNTGLWFVKVRLDRGSAIPTCRIGTIFKILFPIRKDDEVLVCLPAGTPNEGPIAVPALFNVGTPPPAGWNNDAVIFTSDKPIRIIGSDVSMGSATDSNNPAANNKPDNAQYLGTDHHKDLGDVLNKLSTLSSAVDTLAQQLGSLIVPAPPTLPGLAAAIVAIIAAGKAYAIPTPPGQGVSNQIQTYGQGTHLSGSATVGD